MNVCPHCKADPCLPLWRRLSLGPMSSAACQVCGYRVRVDFYRSLFAAAPTFLLIAAVASGALQSAPAALILLPVCLASTFAIDALWVPLRWDELTNASLVAAGRARIAAEKQARIARQLGKQSR